MYGYDTTSLTPYYYHRNLQGRRVKTTKCCFYEDETAQSKERGESQTCADEDSRLCDGGVDVIAILNSSGTKVAEYTYDAFGNCELVSSSTTDNNIANYNPIRYRGYYYDRETKLYYLNSRYYNPEWRRFISTDDTGYLELESVKVK